VNTDLAIQGRGLFIIKDPISGTFYYTRDGQFRLSRDGYMVNSGGLKLQGFKVDEKGNIIGTGLEDIHVVQQLPPKTTSTINFLQPSNLNADAGVPAVAFDPTNPASYNYKYTVTIYDSLGTPYQADLFFRKTGTNTWEIHLRSDIDPATAGYELSGDRTLSFDPSGKLIYDNTTVLREPSPDGKSYLYYLNPAALTVPTTTPGGGTFPANTDWRVYVGETPQTGAPNTGEPISNSYITQYSADFVITADQNGYAKGDLVDVYVLSEDGPVVGVYSNGKSLPLYRVAIGSFPTLRS
jgi:flagellar hook protein FlgE